MTSVSGIERNRIENICGKSIFIKARVTLSKNNYKEFTE